MQQATSIDLTELRTRQASRRARTERGLIGMRAGVTTSWHMRLWRRLAIEPASQP